ncbi:MAG TPA: response regulator [Geobacteraceae bacterium]|nr:response regulator [Geobacteraceae bacterium]
MALPKILLVDDTKLFLKLEQEYLRQSSAQILTAGNGQEALEIAHTNRPDLIFMDLNMPVMDGITCCTALKANPALRDIPVILVTTEGTDDSVARCKGAGCDGFLTKPIDRKAFLDIGRAFLPGIDRRERRIPCRIKVLFRINDRENLCGTCLDLCSGGMYVAFPGEVKLGDKVELSMLVSGNSDDLVEAWGRVSWVNSSEDRKKPKLSEGFGVEFQAITEESVRLIKRFIEQGILIRGGA